MREEHRQRIVQAAAMIHAGLSQMDRLANEIMDQEYASLTQLEQEGRQGERIEETVVMIRRLLYAAVPRLAELIEQTKEERHE